MDLYSRARSPIHVLLNMVALSPDTIQLARLSSLSLQRSCPLNHGSSRWLYRGYSDAYCRRQLWFECLACMSHMGWTLLKPSRGKVVPPPPTCGASYETCLLIMALSSGLVRKLKMPEIEVPCSVHWERHS